MTENEIEPAKLRLMLAMQEKYITKLKEESKPNILHLVFGMLFFSVVIILSYGAIKEEQLSKEICSKLRVDFVNEGHYEDYFLTYIPYCKGK
jgi:hypothetical protein